MSYVYLREKKEIPMDLVNLICSFTGTASKKRTKTWKDQVLEELRMRQHYTDYCNYYLDFEFSDFYGDCMEELKYGID